MILFLRLALVVLLCRAAVFTNTSGPAAAGHPSPSSEDEVPTIVAGVVTKIWSQFDAIERGQKSQIPSVRDSYVPGAIVATTVDQAVVRLEKGLKATGAELAAWVQADRQQRSNDTAAAMIDYKEVAAARHALSNFLNASQQHEAPFLSKIAELEKEEKEIETSLQQQENALVENVSRNIRAGASQNEHIGGNRSMAIHLRLNVSHRGNNSRQMQSSAKQRPSINSNRSIQILSRKDVPQKHNKSFQMQSSAKQNISNKNNHSTQIHSKLNPSQKDKSLQVQSTAKHRTSIDNSHFMRSHSRMNVSDKSRTSPQMHSNAKVKAPVGINRSMKNHSERIASLKIPTSLRLQSSANHDGSSVREIHVGMKASQKSQTSLRIHSNEKQKDSFGSNRPTIDYTALNASQKSQSVKPSSANQKVPIGHSGMHVPQTRRSGSHAVVESRSSRPHVSQQLEEAADAKQPTPHILDSEAVNTASHQLEQSAERGAQEESKQRSHGIAKLKDADSLSRATTPRINKSAHDIEEDLHEFLAEPNAVTHARHHKHRRKNSRSSQRSPDPKVNASFGDDFVVPTTPVHMSKNLRSYLAHQS